MVGKLLFVSRVSAEGGLGGFGQGNEEKKEPPHSSNAKWLHPNRVRMGTNIII